MNIRCITDYSTADTANHPKPIESIIEEAMLIYSEYMQLALMLQSVGLFR